MEIEIIVEPLDEITFGFQSPTIGLPKGGTSGQVLSKKTDADYDTDWVSVEAAAIPDNSITKSKLVLSVRQSLDKADTSVQQVVGKGLSTNDYTNAEKSKLAGIAAGAEVNAVDSVNGQTGAVALDKTSVGLSNVDNVQQYPNSNPSSFETPAQLDARDTADRNRSNHTGTQAISTVNGLQNALDAKVESDPTSPNATSLIWVGTQAQYDGISTKVATTLYFIEE